MKIQFTARHFKPTDAIRDHATAHLERLEKYDNIMHAEVILTEEQKPSKTVRNAELIVKVFGTILTTKSNGVQFPEAIDAAAKKLETQLKRYKDKHSAERLRKSKLTPAKKAVAE
ncbi:MAG: ribosome hibernation-promoting factor, HPF/YfiA family [Blastocatellia bacterium]